MLRCDEKYAREYAVLNVCGVIMTTNHKAGGMYLPPDDRRHFVAWSDRTKEDASEGFWTRLWGWYYTAGIRNVAAHLRALDLSGFNPKAPPQKTMAFWEIVNANRAPEDAELSDVLEDMGRPPAVTVSQVVRCDQSLGAWLRGRRNARQIPHRFEAAGYVSVPNPGAKDGRWAVNKRRQVVYARDDLPVRERIAAVNGLIESENERGDDEPDF